MKLFMRMVLVAAVAVVLMNMDSNEAFRVLNTDVALQKGTTVNPPQLPTFIKQIVQMGLDNEGMTTTIPSRSTNRGLDNLSKRGFYIPLVIRQRLQKGPVPSGGNPSTNIP